MSGKTKSKTAQTPAKTTARRGEGVPVAPTNAQQTQRWLKWWLPDDTSFAGLKLHGNTTWELVQNNFPI